MRDLKVIMGTKKEKKQIDFGAIYLRSALRALESSKDILSDRDALKKYVYNSIKYIAQLERRSHGLSEYEELRNMFDAICSVKEFAGHLTSAEFITMFPIEKKYDGKKYGAKDYFYTMEMLENYPKDKPIRDGGKDNKREAVSYFMWDYQNWDVTFFVLYEMDILSKLHKIDTGKDVFDEFCESQGVHIRKYTMHTDEKGKQYMMDEEGNIHGIKKKFPRYLKPLKGGAAQ